MYIELHLLQSFPPANLNRDDTNNPKDCEFGGVRRARISSQCLKRAIRKAPIFDATTGVPGGVRTKRLVATLAEDLVALGKDAEQAQAVAAAFVPQYLTKIDAKSGEKQLTDVVVFVGPRERERIVASLLQHWDALAAGKDAPAKAIAKELIKAHAQHTSAPDMALYGRMLASTPELNIEAACQVAHAISTHRVSMEMDFFTAVDDLQPDSEPGANMMGYTAFDSACFYRYARIDWDQLVTTLGDPDLARRTVEGFLRAAEEAVPSGKKNAFAPFTPPSLALAVVRRDGMSWSLVNAFERPVQPDRAGGLVGPSIAALDDYWGRLCAAYGCEDLACVAARTLEEYPLPNLAPHLIPSREEWLQAVLAALPAKEGRA